MATELKILSAGAVQPGLATVISAFRRATGCRVEIAFATAPEIRKRIGGAPVDVVIAPETLLDDLVNAGTVDKQRVALGRIGVGIMVRAGAPLPKIADVDEFKQSLLDAESVVYNQASTGIYLEALFDKLRIAEPIQSKTTRYPNAAAVLDHVSKGRGREIGFGATTVIVEGKAKGLVFVGPLPAQIQNYTTYLASVTRNATSVGTAREFIGYLGTPSSRATLSAAGIQ